MGPREARPRQVGKPRRKVGGGGDGKKMCAAQPGEARGLVHTWALSRPVGFGTWR